VFAPGKSFQPSLMFADKVGIYLSGAPEMNSGLELRLCP
jgi:hypothetical protein